MEKILSKYFQRTVHDYKRLEIDDKGKNEGFVKNELESATIFK